MGLRLLWREQADSRLALDTTISYQRRSGPRAASCPHARKPMCAHETNAVEWYTTLVPCAVPVPLCIAPARDGGAPREVSHVMVSPRPQVSGRASGRAAIAADRLRRECRRGFRPPRARADRSTAARRRAARD